MYKYILLSTLLLLAGCYDNQDQVKNKIEIYNTPLILNEYPNDQRVMQLSVKVNDSTKVFYKYFGDVGFVAIQKEIFYDDWYTIIIWQKMFNNKNKVCYHVRWKGKSKNFNVIPKYAGVFTSLNEEHFRVLYAEHKGNYYYEKYDTIKVDYKIVEELINHKTLKIDQIINYKGDNAKEEENKTPIKNYSNDFNNLSNECYKTPIKVIGNINHLRNEIEIKFKWPSLTYHGCYIKKEGGFVIQSETDHGDYIIGIREIDNVYQGFFIKCHSSYTDYKTFQDSSLVFTNLSQENFYKVFPNFNGRYSYEKTDTLQIDLTFYDRLYQDSLLTLNLINNKD